MKKWLIVVISVVLALNILAVGIYIGSTIGKYNAIKDIENGQTDNSDDVKEDAPNGNEGNTENIEDKEDTEGTEDNEDVGTNDINDPDGENSSDNENNDGQTDSSQEGTVESPVEDKEPTVTVCEHSFEEASIIKKAKCEAEGIRLLICQKCGEEKEEAVSALGHTEVKVEAVLPACEADGSTEGAYCSTCGKILVVSNVIAAKGHTIITGGAQKAPSCTEAGSVPEKYCSVCGTVMEEARSIAPLGHSEIIYEGVSATCTESGLTDGKKCSTCGVILVEREVIPAGHNVGDNGACSLCGQSFFTAGLSFSAVGSGYMVSGYSGTATTVEIPSTYNGSAVVAIGFGAFEGSGISSISIPSSVRVIESNAFKNCTSLSSISLPSGLEELGSGAFYNCTGLSSVSIPSGLDTLNSEVFRGCSGLNSVSIPSNIESIGENAFYGCSSLTSVSISGASSIGGKAFYGCVALNSITLSKSVLQIGSGAFQNCRKIATVSYDGSIEEYASISFGNSYSDPLWNGGELEN
jgi:hypothetical protein